MRQLTEVSKMLIDYLRKQQFMDAYELFSTDAESIDPMNARNGPIKGLDKLIDMEKEFLSRVTIHHIEISDAVHSGSYFCVRLAMHFSIGEKEKTLDELCVYKVSQGKIVSQQFFIS